MRLGRDEQQMIKSWGACWALLALLGLVAFALWLDLSLRRHGCLAGAGGCASTPAASGEMRPDLSQVVKLGQFFEDHNGAVSAAAAIVVAAFTILLAWKTAGLSAATRGLQDFARIQSEDAKYSIAEAARAARAMESVAASLDVNARMIVQSVDTNKEIASWQREFGQRQMRAYLSVVGGAGIYQERERNIRFEAKPRIVNSGLTPANDVRYVAKAQIVEVVAAFGESFDFDLGEPLQSGPALGPRESLNMSSIVSDYVDDAEVAAIKGGSQRRLFVWGKVTYRDIFGEVHQTIFAHSLQWLPNDVLWVTYAPKYNRQE
jgi:hypothetical protein